MGYNAKGTVRALYPICGFVAFIYLLNLVLSWSGVFPLTTRDPIIILGYLAIIHLLAIPVLWWALRDRPQFYLPFIILNSIWVVGAVVILILIFTNVFGDIAMSMWRANPFHQLTAYANLFIALVIDVLIIVHMNNIHQVVEVGEAQTI